MVPQCRLLLVLVLSSPTRSTFLSSSMSPYFISNFIVVLKIVVWICKTHQIQQLTLSVAGVAAQADWHQLPNDVTLVQHESGRASERDPRAAGLLGVKHQGRTVFSKRKRE